MDVLSESQRARLIADLGDKATKVEWVLELLQEAVNSGKAALAKANAEREADRIDSDQRFHDLERKFVSLREGKAQASEEVEGLRKSKEEAIAARQEALRKVLTLEKQIEAIESQALSSKGSHEQIRIERDDALVLCAQRKKMIDTLKSDLEDSAKRCASLSQTAKDSSRLCRDAQSQSQLLQFDVDKLEREKSMLKKHADFLETELESKNTELLKIRRDASKESITFRSQLDESVSRANELAKKLDDAKKRLVEKTESVDELLKSAKEAREDSLEKEEALNQELASQRKLCELYKASVAEAEEQNSNLVAEIETAQQIIDKLRQQSAAAVATHKKQVDELRRTRDRLEQSVRDAEERLKANADELAAAKSAASKASDDASSTDDASASTKSPLMNVGSKSISVTQWYDRVVKAEANLEEERRERARVEKYLHQILREVEQKAPIIAEQRRDYERALRSHSELSVRLESALTETSRLKSERDLAKEAESKATEEALSLRKSCDDLSRQIRLLLWKRQSKKRGPGDSDSPVSTSSFGRSVDADSVISEHLVTFASVEELQERNQQLLRVVRRLSKKHEAFLENRTSVEESVQNDLAAKFAKELEEMRAARQRQEAMVVAVVRQRDMYKDMLTKRDQNDAGPTVSDGSSSLPRTTSSSSSVSATASLGIAVETGTQKLTPRSSSSSTTTAATVVTPATQAEVQRIIAAESSVKELEQQLKDARENHEVYRKDNERMVRQMQSSLDELRSESSTLRVDLAKSSAQAEFHKARYEHLKDAAESARKDAERERGERAGMSSKLVRFQQLLSDAEHDADARKLEVEKMRSKVMNLGNEKAIWEATEQRLREQIKSLRDEAARQSELREVVDRIQRGIDAKSGTDLDRLREETETLRVQLSQARKAMQEQQLLASRARQEARAQAGRDASKIERFQKDALEFNAKLANAKAAIAAQTERTKAAESRALAAERRFDGHLDRLANADDGNADAIERLRRVLEAENSESRLAESERLKFAETKLSEIEVHVEQYRTIASAAEEALAKFQEKADERNGALKERIAELETTLANRTKEIEEREKTISASAVELTRVQEAGAASEAKAAAAAAEFKRKLDAVEERLKEAEKFADALKRDAEEHEKARVQAEANYQRELQLHADNVKASSAAQDRLKESEKTIRELSSQIDMMKAESVESHASWNSQKGMLERQVEDLKSREGELKRQTELLHSQLDDMAADMNRVQALQRKAITDGAAAMLDPSKISDSSVDIDTDAEMNRLRESLTGLRDVNKFLRREKNIADCRADVAEQKLARTEKRAEMLARSLDEARAAEKAALEQAASQSTDAAEHQKLRLQIMDLNLIRESNVALRQSAKRSGDRAIELEKRLIEVEASIEPLRLREKTLMNEAKAAKAEYASLKKDRDRWQESAKSLIATRNTIDPTEHEELKAKLKSMTEEHSAEVKTLTERGTKIRKLAVKLKQSKKKLETELKDLKKKLSKKIDPDPRAASAISELESVKRELEETKTRASTLSTKATAEEKKCQEMSQQNKVLNKRLENQAKIVQGFRRKNQRLEQQLKLAQKRASAVSEIVSADDVKTSGESQGQTTKEDDKAAALSRKRKATVMGTEQQQESKERDAADSEGNAEIEQEKAAAKATKKRKLALEKKKVAAIAEQKRKDALAKKMAEQKAAALAEKKRKDALAKKMAEQKAAALAEKKRKDALAKKMAEQKAAALAEKKRKDALAKIAEEKAAKAAAIAEKKRIIAEKRRKIQERILRERREKEAAEAATKMEGDEATIADIVDVVESGEGDETVEVTKEADMPDDDVNVDDDDDGKAVPADVPVGTVDSTVLASSLSSEMSEIDSLKARLMRKRRLSHESGAQKMSSSLSENADIATSSDATASAPSTTAPTYKWQFALNSNKWRDYLPEDSKKLEAAFESGQLNPTDLAQVKLSNKFGNFIVTLFPLDRRGQIREKSSKFVKKIRRVPIVEGSEATSSTLSAAATPFVPREMKTRRGKKRGRMVASASSADVADASEGDVSPPPKVRSRTTATDASTSESSADLDMLHESSDATTSVGTISPVRDVMSSNLEEKGGEVEILAAGATSASDVLADQESKHDAEETAPAPPVRQLSSSLSAGGAASENAKLLLRAARFAKKPNLPVSEDTSTAEGDASEVSDTAMALGADETNEDVLALAGEPDAEGMGDNDEEEEEEEKNGDDDDAGIMVEDDGVADSAVEEGRYFEEDGL